ncbi:MAG: type II secretion system minor pseudopilin GspI [Planctomycetota bacterium]
MPRRDDAGFTLIEVLVALAVVSMVVLTFLGIRTTSLVDATYARNWRLAREIADERMSELQAGAHESPPQSGNEVSLGDKYEDGWSYKIVVGETDVTDAETEVANLASGESDEATERNEWERSREQYRKAKSLGMSQQEYQDKLYDDETQRKLLEETPSETELVDVGVIVYFPKVNADREGDRNALMIKAKISTLAISGMTPEQAKSLAETRGEASGGGSAAASANPLSGGKGGQ